MPKGWQKFLYFLFGLFGFGVGAGVLIAWKKGEFEYGLTGLIVYLFLASLIAFVGFHGAFSSDSTRK